MALHIRKDIPVAGGMAGGSADAAAALVACDVLWDTRLDRETLLELGARLGSDVPFALLGGTARGHWAGGSGSPRSRSRGSSTGSSATPTAACRPRRCTPNATGYVAASPAPWPVVSDDLMAGLKTGNAPALGQALATTWRPRPSSAAVPGPGPRRGP